MLPLHYSLMVRTIRIERIFIRLQRIAMTTLAQFANSGMVSPRRHSTHPESINFEALPQVSRFSAWWTRGGLSSRTLRCKRSALHLSYAPINCTVP